MPPSMTLIKLNAIVSVIKATFQHFTSSKWRDWDLTTHIQFEILRRLDASMLNWTIEDVCPPDPHRLMSAVTGICHELFT